jgi:sporulation integral membrane protein YlbJ
MGIISGYPVGAKIVGNFKENNMCTEEECERLLAYTNNSGPLFIIGTVGISLFSNSTIGFLLLLTHLLACLTVGIIFRFWKCNFTGTSSNYYISNKKDVSFANLGEILSVSIISAIKSVMVIGGFVVLFSVILSILVKSNFISLISLFFYPIFKFWGITNIEFVSAFFKGIIELTNGVMAIATIPSKAISINIILISFLLGFGGISVLLQVFSITSKYNIPIKTYIIGKLLQGIFAAIYTYIFINYFPIFNFNL